MTFGILSDIVGRKKVTHIFISWGIDLCHLFSSSIFSSKVLIPLLVCMSISGMITSYMQSWKKSKIWTWCPFLSHKYVQNTGNLFMKILWNIKLASTRDSWDKNGSTNLSPRFFPTSLLCLRSSGLLPVGCWTPSSWSVSSRPHSHSFSSSSVATSGARFVNCNDLENDHDGDDDDDDDEFLKRTRWGR